MADDKFPVMFYSLDPTDEIVVTHDEAESVVKVGGFLDPKGRAANFMIEQFDGDRFFFVTESIARDFILLHGMAEVSDEAMESLRQKAEQDE
jgi:hypothetical protein